MRGYMFRNRWLALLFVGLTLAAVTRLIGTEEKGGTLNEAARKLVAQKQSADEIIAQHSGTASAKEEVAIEFTPDEELIDPAAGEDPSPVDEFSAAPAADPEAVPHDEVVIVSREADPGEAAPQ